MGLLDFLKGEKKYCDICGDEIKLLGNKKLADGNCCKKCANKLSPFFHERKHSTVAEIIQQIDARENNEQVVQDFTITRTIGTSSNYRVYIDDTKNQFFVNNRSKAKEGNPDVLSIDAVTGCDIDIRESKSELHTKDKDGKLVSFQPKQYEYRYYCDMILYVDHPYFDQMNFQVGNSVFIENPLVVDFMHESKPTRSMVEENPVTLEEYEKAKKIVENSHSDPHHKEEARRIIHLYEASKSGYVPRAKSAVKEVIPTFVPDLTRNADYQELLMIANEIKDALVMKL